MTQSPPEEERPVSLRATRELSEHPAQRAADELAPSAGGDTATQDHQLAVADNHRDAISIAAAGAVLLASIGWLFERRRRIARRGGAPVGDVGAVPANASSFDPAPDSALPTPWPEQPELPGDDERGAEMAPALVQTRRQNRPSVLGVTGQKRLVKILMWVRTLAGAAAILAAIAIVVFWLIETTDSRPGETGLNTPLLVVLLAGWAISWAAGRLANLLHRSFFGRVHPKFDN